MNKTKTLFKLEKSSINKFKIKDNLNGISITKSLVRAISNNYAIMANSKMENKTCLEMEKRLIIYRIGLRDAKLIRSVKEFRKSAKLVLKDNKIQKIMKVKVHFTIILKRMRNRFRQKCRT